MHSIENLYIDLKGIFFGTKINYLIPFFLLQTVGGPLAYYVPSIESWEHRQCWVFAVIIHIDEVQRSSRELRKFLMTPLGLLTASHSGLVFRPCHSLLPFLKRFIYLMFYLFIHLIWPERNTERERERESEKASYQVRDLNRGQACGSVQRLNHHTTSWSPLLPF